jgi:hypothetical protein
VAAEEVGAARRGAREGREDEVVVLPEGTGGEPFLVLKGPVALWGFCGLVGALYGATLAVFGLFKDGAGPGLAQGAPYVERCGGAAGVYVVPLQAE